MCSCVALLDNRTQLVTNSSSIQLLKQTTKLTSLSLKIFVLKSSGGHINTSCLCFLWLIPQKLFSKRNPENVIMGKSITPYFPPCVAQAIMHLLVRFLILQQILMNVPTIQPTCATLMLPVTMLMATTAVNVRHASKAMGYFVMVRKLYSRGFLCSLSTKNVGSVEDIDDGTYFQQNLSPNMS